jgi:metallo-beta-lactamase family protein
MKITFHGAARTVTGSKHIIHLNTGQQILLDCGMFQGMGKETLELNSNLGFDATGITYVIISHAHIDHTGLLPLLVRQGYRGPIYCTPQTADLARIMLIDAAKIQEGDAVHINKIRDLENRPHVQPLYTEEDARQVFPLLRTIPYDQPFKIDEDVELRYTDCGHLLGSAAVNLKLKENGRVRNLTFSGDLGRYNDMLLRQPEPFPQADIIIMESTYGNRLHDHLTPAGDKLLNYIVDTCLKKKGKLIIPAFSVGRTQEVLYILNRLENERRLPPLDYFVDSPLSIDATEVIREHPECFNNEVQELLKKDHDIFGFEGLKFVKSAAESIALEANPEPCVIISASGMAEAGRIKYHLAQHIKKRSTTVLFTGYCEPSTLGGQLKAGAKHITIFGKHYDVKATIGEIAGLSAHGDYEDMERWLSCQDPAAVSRLFLVHGEYETQIDFREKLLKRGFRDVEIPSMHQEVGLG